MDRTYLSMGDTLSCADPIAVFRSHGRSIDPRWIWKLEDRIPRLDYTGCGFLFPYRLDHARPHWSGLMHCQFQQVQTGQYWFQALTFSACRNDLFEEKDKVVGIACKLDSGILW